MVEWQFLGDVILGNLSFRGQKIKFGIVDGSKKVVSYGLKDKRFYFFS